MASFVPTPAAKEYLDSLADLEVALFTVPPTAAGDDGTEVSGGGYAPAPYVTPAAVDGLVGQTARRVGTNILFSNMPVASDMIHGIALRDPVSGDLRAVDDTWTPENAFPVGGNLLIASLTFYTKK